MGGLYSWGANTYGQLSLEHCDDVHQPTLTTSSRALDKSSIDQDTQLVDMEGGANHMMIIDENGNLFACGDNRNSQLFLVHPSECGALKSEGKLTRFTKVMGGVASVACGWDFSVVAMKNGSVLHSSHQGRLFDDDFGGKRVCKVSCGVHHSFALTEDHVLFGFGDNKSGELGSNIKDSNRRWIKVAEGVKDVKAGASHSLLLMQDGTLKFLGRSKFKQCPPDIIPGKIRHIGSGWNHTIVITEVLEAREGVTCQAFYVHCYGKNDLGQLGNPDPTLHYNCFVLPLKPIDLRVGSEHAMVLFGNGKIIIWGWNEHGTCARAPSLMTMPEILNHFDRKVVLIGCTFAGCFAFVE